MGHLDSNNSLKLNINQALLDLGYLPIEDRLKDLLYPFAGKKLLVVTDGCEPLECRLNAKATFLRGRGLREFIKQTGASCFTASLIEEGTLYLRPRPSPSQPGKNPLEESLDHAGRPDPLQSGKGRSIKSKAEKKEKGDEIPGQQMEKKKKREARNEVFSRMIEKITAEFGELPELPVKRKAGKASPAGPAQRLAAGKKRQSRSRKEEKAGTISSGRKGASNRESSTPAAPARSRAEQTREQSMSGNTREDVISPSVLPTVKVNFFPGEDEGVLKLTGSSEPAPVSDLYLHRQALALLLSPGFETLLSLNAARDIQLLDYQLSTVRHVLKSLRGRALLCDEVGLGKTIEAGLITLEYLMRGLVRRVLVLTPPSLVEQWRAEMQTRFNLDFVTYDAPAFKTNPQPWTSFPRIIASIDTAKRDPHKERAIEPAYDLVIVDEAHHLKKQRTQAYQLVSQLKKKYILLLTATPVENNLEELFSLITLLQPGHLETAASFKKKYISRGDPLKPKNAGELKKLVREVMVRNRRSETGVITSRRRAEVVEIALSPEEAAFYQRLTTFVRGYYTPGSDRASGGVNQFVLKTLQREVGSSIEAVLPTLAKMAAGENCQPAQRRLLETLAAQAGAVPHRAKALTLIRLLQEIQGKAIVFTSFRETQRFLAGLLRREGLTVAELHGGMRRAEKEEHVRAFAGDARVLVSTETGSEGRNLQFCNVMINYDLPWNPMRIEQRIGRIHRLGQEKDVSIYNLSAAGTVEAHILELLDAKINMFQLVVGELDMILGNLQEKRDFEDIIMDIWANAADEGSLKAGLDDLGERLTAAKKHYLAVKEIDDELLGELFPEE